MTAAAHPDAVRGLMLFYPAFNIAELAEKFGGRYFSTPKKMGAQTAEANINAGIAAAKQIVDYLVNGNERFRVNK